MRPRSSSRLAPLPVLLLLLASCQPAASSDLSEEPTLEGAARVQATITGGDHEGEYDATLVDAGCSLDAFGGDAFEVASNTVEGSEGFEGVDISVYDAAAARSGGTDDFVMVLGFADGNPEISPADGHGSGTVTIEEDAEAETAVVTVEGTPDDGGEATVEVECFVVRTF